MDSFLWKDFKDRYGGWFSKRTQFSTDPYIPLVDTLTPPALKGLQCGINTSVGTQSQTYTHTPHVNMVVVRGWKKSIWCFQVPTFALFKLTFFFSFFPRWDFASRKLFLVSSPHHFSFTLTKSGQELCIHPQYQYTATVCLFWPEIEILCLFRK